MEDRGVRPDGRPPSVKVALVDDHPVVIEGIKSWITQDPEQRVEVIASGDDIDDVLAGPGGAADVLLVDLNLRGHFVTDRIGELSSAGRRVVVYSQHTDPDTVLAVLEAGASEFLAKDEGREHCVETIVAAATDRPDVTPSVAGVLSADTRRVRPPMA